MITQQRLKELFTYKDGELFRKVSRGRGSGKRWVEGTKLGWMDNYGYMIGSVDYQRCRIHHLIWIFHNGDCEFMQIDHIDGNPINNRIENLRLASSSENAQNQRKPRITNKLQIQGVHKVNNKFRAVLHMDYKKIHLGYFDTAEGAHQAYLDAKRKHHKFCTI